MRFWCVPLILGSTAVLAQAPALTIEQRLDKLERENLELKRQLKARGAGPVTPAATSAKPTGKLEPGWSVLVYPRAFKGQDAYPVGSFVATGGGFRFGDLRDRMPHSGWASFKGEGVFQAYEEGPYTFAIEVRAEESTSFTIKMTCDATLRVNDTDLIPPDQGKFFIEHRGTFSRPLSGGIKLAPGRYPIEFQLGCQYNNGFRDVTADEMFQNWPPSKTVFDNTRLSINVFGPADRAARPLRDNELAHEIRRSTTAR